MVIILLTLLGIGENKAGFKRVFNLSPKGQDNYTPKVWNPTEETVSTCMQGAWFTFKPNTMKTMDDTKALFVTGNRKETGLVVLPDEFDPLSDKFIEGYEKTEEGIQLLKNKREEGITNLINHHMQIVRNNQVSLRNDLAHKNPAADPIKLAALEASQGELNSMRLVAKYKGKNSQSEAKKVEEIEKLIKEIGPFVS